MGQQRRRLAVVACHFERRHDGITDDVFGEARHAQHLTGQAGPVPALQAVFRRLLQNLRDALAPAKILGVGPSSVAPLLHEERAAGR